MDFLSWYLPVKDRFFCRLCGGCKLIWKEHKGNWMNFTISHENQDVQQPPQNLWEANGFASVHIAILAKRIFRTEDRKQKWVKLHLLCWMLFSQTCYFFHNVLLGLKLKNEGPKLLSSMTVQFWICIFRLANWEWAFMLCRWWSKVNFCVFCTSEQVFGWQQGRT